ncbi:MAG: PEPxxWA-CTERM sorting domain-containing protein [Azoarcus sp.]|jgi:hypothetical protein|nr:PEPxxWA-CTERM sorting domain-containing protein [Azoarcus sp.]
MTKNINRPALLSTKGFVMNKLLSISLLAAGVMVATPAAAADIYNFNYGGRLFIQDADQPIQLEYGDAWGRGSYSFHGMDIAISAIDHNGNLVGGWVDIFHARHITVPDQARGFLSLQGGVPAPYCNGQTAPLCFQPGPDAVEIVFKWTNIETGQTYYSDILAGYDSKYANTNPNGIKGLYSGVSYDAICVGGTCWSQVGFEHIDAAWDFNDGLLKLTNVGADPMPIPEPETYAMMLAGLGLVGAMVRRRRKSQ